MKDKGQLTFLLVDSDTSRLDRAISLVQAIGYYSCLQAEDGAEAWAMFKNFNIDFVISTFDVPEVSGLSLLKLVRSHEDYANTPFILIHSNVTAKQVNLIGKAGVSDLIIAPFKDEVFERSICIGWRRYTETEIIVRSLNHASSNVAIIHKLIALRDIKMNWPGSGRKRSMDELKISASFIPHRNCHLKRFQAFRHPVYVFLGIVREIIVPLPFVHVC